MGWTVGRQRGWAGEPGRGSLSLQDDRGHGVRSNRGHLCLQLKRVARERRPCSWSVVGSEPLQGAQEQPGNPAKMRVFLYFFSFDFLIF